MSHDRFLWTLLTVEFVLGLALAAPVIAFLWGLR